MALPKSEYFRITDPVTGHSTIVLFGAAKAIYDLDVRTKETHERRQLTPCTKADYEAWLKGETKPAITPKPEAKVEHNEYGDIFHAVALHSNRIDKLEAENAELKETVEALREIVAKLLNRPKPGPKPTKKSAE